MYGPINGMRAAVRAGNAAIVVGVPAGFDQVSATKPYYRSIYALVFPKGKGLDGVKSSDDLLALPREMLATLRIGLYDKSPASQWLARHDLVDRGVPYRIMNADPAQYPGQIIERDLEEGKIDAAIVWGPIAGYFARRAHSPELVVAPIWAVPMDIAPKHAGSASGMLAVGFGPAGIISPFVFG